MKLLEDRSFCVSKAEVRSNIAVPFVVDRPFAALIIRLDYAPHRVTDEKLCAEEIETCLRRYLPREEWPKETIRPGDYDPLFNFITLSLDCGDRYAGCAHRHDPSLTVRISEQEASPGFDPAPIREGPWQVMLHVHAVITSQIQCHLQIWGAEEADGEYSISTL